MVKNNTCIDIVVVLNHRGTEQSSLPYERKSEVSQPSGLLRIEVDSVFEFMRPLRAERGKTNNYCFVE